MRKKILLVEEDVIELNMLSHLLTCKGYEVCALSRSDKLFYEIPKCDPDLILLDDGLKMIDSGVLSRALRALEEINRIPVMVISGKTYISSEFVTGDEKVIYGIDILAKEIEYQLAA